MTQVEAAAKALRETADLLDALPVLFRPIDKGPSGGYLLPTKRLRDEADHIERTAAAVRESKAS